MASAEQSITRGILERLVSGATASDLSTLPVLQILHYEQISKSADGRDRFKLALSDFDTKMMGGTGVQDVCDLIFKNLVRPYVVVRLTQFTCTRMSKTGMPIINIQGMQVLEEFGNCGNQMLGNPRAFGNQQLAAAPVKAELNQSAGFYGNQQPQQQPQQSLPHRTASKQMAPSARHANIYPIEALSPFGQKWTIKVRCTSVSDIKTWHNQRGEGHLFSVTFMDQSGEIKATGFNQECDNLRPLFEENQVYYISYPAKIGFAKRQYSNVNNDYEMTFESGTVVEKAEDPESVPQVRFNFTNISDLQNVDKDGLVDVIGIVKTVGEVGEAVSKATQKPYKKRELELVDETGFSIRLTIWGDQASTFNTSPDSVVAFKGLKVGDFGGRSLSLLSSGSMTVNPDVEEAFRLKGWYDAQGRNESFNTHNNLVSGTTGAAGGAATVYKTLAQVKDENIGMGDEGEYFTCKATIVFIKQGEFAYPACPNTDRCQKKVLEISEGEWRCEKCSQTFPAPHYRYLTSVHVNDHTGQIWLSCFDESGQVVFGTGAGELKRLQDEDPKQWEQIVKDASCRTWVFRVRAKQDTYMDQMRVRYQVVSCRAVEWAKEANRLAEVIKGYSM